MKNENYDNITYGQLLSSSLNQIAIFKKTLGYKQLSDEQKIISDDVLLKLVEFMYFIHNQTINQWETESLKVVLIHTFPEEILANRFFFESIPNICLKFFEFLYFNCSICLAKEWIDMIANIDKQILSNYESILQKNPAEQDFLNLGEEIGMNMSILKEVDELYFLYLVIEFGV